MIRKRFPFHRCHELNATAQLCRLRSSTASIITTRDFSEEGEKRSKAYSWRKDQLGAIEKRFGDDDDQQPRDIDNEEDLQSMWKQMESRVVGRRPRGKLGSGMKTGRSNVRSTDEEMWLKEGMYQQASECATAANDDDDDDDRDRGGGGGGGSKDKADAEAKE